MARRRGKRSPGRTGCLFWLFILLIIVVVLVYRSGGTVRETITSLLRRDSRDRTGEVRVEERDVPSPEVTVDPGGGPGREPGDGGSEESVSGRTGADTSREEPAEREPPAPDDESGTGAVASGKDGAAASKPAGSEEKPQVAARGSSDRQQKLKDLAATIYFVKIDRQSGSASLHPVHTTVQYVDSPITRTVHSLLKGPSASQQAQGIVSFIPEGTELISAHLSGGNLTLNFNSRFEDNYRGRQAILLQLSQVMLTAFEFTPVSTVSILIEG
ncbi:MAG: GerMN domain-containing protein, partial [Spirochaetota bacterium]